MRAWQIPVLITMTAIAAVASLHFGLRNYSTQVVFTALFAPDGSPDSLIISGLRVPRTLVALVVGAALGTSGLLMQSVFRNPLAEPGLLGVNAGASFAVVAMFSFLGVTSLWALSLAALLGAGFAMVMIFALVVFARGALTPISLILAGVTLAAFLSALTQVMIVTNEAAMEALLFWLAGGFADRDVSVVLWLGPFLLIGLVAAIFNANALDAMVTGETAAQALGVDTKQLRIMVLSLASALAAFCVVIAGPVGFIGLVAPHIARLMAGPSHAGLFPRVALIGALLAVLADIGARLVVAPQEAPVTALLAMVGTPVLIALVRTRRMSSIA